MCFSKRKKRDSAFPKLILPQISFLRSLSWDLGLPGHVLELEMDSFNKYLLSTHYMPDADRKSSLQESPDLVLKHLPAPYVISFSQQPPGGRLRGRKGLTPPEKGETSFSFHTLGNTRAFCPIFHFLEAELEI